MGLWETALAYVLKLISDYALHLCFLILLLFLTEAYRRAQLRPWTRFDALRHPVNELLIVVIFLVPSFLVVISFLNETDQKVIGENRLQNDQLLNVLAAGGMGGGQRQDRDIDEANRATGVIAKNTFDDLRILFPQNQIRGEAFFLLWSRDNIQDVFHSPIPTKDFAVFTSQSLVGHTLQVGEPQYCPDIIRRSQYPSCLPFVEPHFPHLLLFVSIVCFPLAFNGRMVGAVCLDSTRPHEFDNIVDRIPSRASPELAQVARLLFLLQRISAAQRPCRDLKPLDK